jgi:hypothetical protein
VAEPLAGNYVVSVPLPEKADLSDWTELMDAVEALCPVRPETYKAQGRSNWRL